VHALQKVKGLLALSAELVEGTNEPLLVQLAALKQAGNLECIGLFPLLDATHTVFQLDHLFNITRALKAAGWKEEDIRGVLGENANRVISDIFPAERMARRPR